MSTANVPKKVPAEPPTPPNWNANLENTISSLAPYKLFPVAAETLEYTVIAALMHPLRVNVIEQVANPMLWTRFVNMRRDMLLGKSDDLQLISKLSADDSKIAQQMHIAQKNAQVAACPYDDNIALLFHCTKDKKNVDNILLQGLDERVGYGGSLGRGVYFASDSCKSIQYDGCGGTMFIFMVLLGDCLSVNAHNIKNFVREPEKQPNQQRNLNDIHFDSIVGRPRLACEYVVYNRYQCCPVYKITYRKENVAASSINVYSQSKNNLPPFCWATMPTPSNGDWPFFARTIFAQMGVQEIPVSDVDTDPKVDIAESAESIENKLMVLSSLGFTNAEMNLETLKNHSFDLNRTINFLLELGDATIGESEILNNNKLAILTDLGFDDTAINAEILKKNSYDLEKSVSDLLARFQQGSDSKINVAGSHPNGNSTKESVNEDCPICSDEYSRSVAVNWKALECNHILCAKCFKQIETTRTTMSGLTHTFSKCPFCMLVSGTEVGTCPDGKMTTTLVQTPCQGYDEFDSIRIEYDVQSKTHQLKRTAFLPNNDEGNELLKLLKIAWDRRITFTVGTSATNGQENVLVWNIHHKTAQIGGVESHGFPDETYMKRCKSELSEFGIK
ncbi:E3 ubiquitin-protein ligase DTX3L [Pseudolycoriella hygida]|uniref:E3 ubiquitin-protein ligase n=1 Tax=Pseudolycoriella hygida TaxID=35572 RepID=A0A9Q0MPD7_9DIPT|nr:E3 ubiquitin-protein ligase DTX3L [Pseudolycoriella hygida]